MEEISKQVLSFTIEFDREVDGRWIADIPALPGVIAYGATKEEAIHRVRVIASETLAAEVEIKETMPHSKHGVASR